METRIPLTTWILLRWSDKTGNIKAIGPFENEAAANRFASAQTDHDRFAYNPMELSGMWTELSRE